MVWEPIEILVKKVKKGEVKAQELVNKSVEQIKDCKGFHALLTDEKSSIIRAAINKAKDIDEAAKRGKKTGRLSGIPFVAKDNFLVKNDVTTAGSKMLSSFEAPYQATTIEKLEAEGAILVAKTNLDSFAHGSSTENSHFGPTLNPHDKTRVPGGSSGGSGAAIALNIAPFALGTDTGGSIRLPASYCGVVGFKPTYGLVSRYGVVAMASSTDVIGPLAKRVEDVALVLDVMSGKDIFDSTSIDRDPVSYLDIKEPIEGKRLGVVKQYFAEGLDVKVKQSIKTAIEVLEDAGAIIDEIDLPSVDLALASYYIIMPAEVSSNMNRYDGQRYGFAAPEAKNLEESYYLTRAEGFELENKRRIMIGTYVLSSGYYEAYYKKAQVVRTKIIKEFESAFKHVDYLIGPTSPTIAFKLGENIKNPLQMYLADTMTAAANLTGVPAISLPAGLVNKMPVGLQIMAPQKHDRQVLTLAKKYEELTE